VTWGILENPAAAAVFSAVLVAYLAVEASVEWRSRRSIASSSASSADADSGSKRALGLLTAVGVALGFAAHGSVPDAAFGTGSGAWAAFAAGVLLLVAAAAGRAWAVRTLGRWFTTSVRTDAGQPVIQDGPYRWVRHPSYTAMLLAFAGIGLCLGNALTAVCFALFPLLGLLVRIRVEERALLARLGEAYAGYSASRRRLIPGVW
jgi:protein-S-isoprenylcysteine O-methyltransferase Ste14